MQNSNINTDKVFELQKFTSFVKETAKRNNFAISEIEKYEYTNVANVVYYVVNGINFIVDMNNLTISTYEGKNKITFDDTQKVFEYLFEKANPSPSNDIQISEGYKGLKTIKLLNNTFIISEIETLVIDKDNDRKLWIDALSFDFKTAEKCKEVFEMIESERQSIKNAQKVFAHFFEKANPSPTNNIPTQKIYTIICAFYENRLDTVPTKKNIGYYFSEEKAIQEKNKLNDGNEYISYYIETIEVQ